MLVSMMQIRYVRMFVSDRIMAMGVRMRFGHEAFMSVPMVLVMNMRMRVDHGTMDVFMLVMFSHVQPHASRH